MPREPYNRPSDLRDQTGAKKIDKLTLGGVVGFSRILRLITQDKNQHKDYEIKTGKKESNRARKVEQKKEMQRDDDRSPLSSPSLRSRSATPRRRRSLKAAANPNPKLLKPQPASHN